MFLEEVRVKSLKAATPPNLPLALTSRDSNSHAGKGEGLVSAFVDNLIHNATSNALQVDSEYSLRLLQNDVGKAQSLPQQRKLSPLITTSNAWQTMLIKGGVGGGCKRRNKPHPPSSICHLLAINLSLERNTPKLKLVYTIWSVCYVN